MSARITLHINDDTPEGKKVSSFMGKQKTKSKFIQSLISWYLDFINVDVDNLTDEQAQFLANNVYFNIDMIMNRDGKSDSNPRLYQPEIYSKIEDIERPPRQRKKKTKQQPNANEKNVIEKDVFTVNSGEVHDDGSPAASSAISDTEIKQEDIEHTGTGFTQPQTKADIPDDKDTESIDDTRQFFGGFEENNEYKDTDTDSGSDDDDAIDPSILSQMNAFL